jgi:heme oxygenase
MNLSPSPHDGTGTSLFAALKAGTADLHRQVEEVFPLLHPGLTVAAYHQHLRRVLGLHLSVEERLTAFQAQSGLCFPNVETIKSQWLISDLLALGDTIETIDDIAPLTRIPPINTREQYVGTSYVIEGSMLGGQVIHRVLRAKLELPDSQMRFYTGYRDDTFTTWKSFQVAGEALISPAGYGAATAQAREIFQIVLECFSCADGRRGQYPNGARGS